MGSEHERENEKGHFRFQVVQAHLRIFGPKHSQNIEQVQQRDQQKHFILSHLLLSVGPMPCEQPGEKERTDEQSRDNPYHRNAEGNEQEDEGGDGIPAEDRALCWSDIGTGGQGRME